VVSRESDESQTSEVESEIAEIEDVATLKHALAEEMTKAEANLAGWQRTQADFINYKRRTEQEKNEISQFARATLILDLLPVLDDLERAFATMGCLKLRRPENLLTLICTKR